MSTDTRKARRSERPRLTGAGKPVEPDGASKALDLIEEMWKHEPPDEDPDLDAKIMRAIEENRP